MIIKSNNNLISQIECGCMICTKYETNKQTIDYFILLVPTLQYNFADDSTLNDRVSLKPRPYYLDYNFRGIIICRMSQNESNLII